METWLEWLGYIASAIVLVSLLMTSLKKLRWINLVGALLFGTYGFLISSIPTGVMNLGIAAIDVYFIVKMYSNKDYFKLLSVGKNDSDYYHSFLDFYHDDINNFQDAQFLDKNEGDVTVFTLRNMNPAGLFVGKKYSDDTLEVLLDYAVPQYRDFKLGRYLFDKEKDFFIDQGYTKLIAYADKENHVSYLEKMGFVLTKINDTNAFIKDLKKGE